MLHVVTPVVTESSCKLLRRMLQDIMSTKKHPLVKYLDRTGRTMTEIAEKAECSRMTLYRLIKGEQNATIDLLSKISAATNGEVPATAFMNRESAA